MRKYSDMLKVYKNINMFLFLMLILFLAILASVVDTNPLQLGFSFLLFLLFSLWGHVVVFPFQYKNGEIFGGFVWGSISGIAIASLITSIIVYSTGWNLPLIFCFTSVLPAIYLMIQFCRKRIVSVQFSTDPHLVIVLLGSLIIVTLIFFFPYKHLGVLVGDNYLYAWLFGHDFINRLVHIESLSRGLPLEGMFFSGEKLSYYWLAYVFPALLHNMKSVALEVQQLLQLTQLYYSILTTSAIILIIKKYTQNKVIYFATVMLALCCYSYVWVINVGINVLTLLSKSYPFVVDDAIMKYSGFSHGFYRFFLVEPQAILAIGLMLMVFYFYEACMPTYRCILIGALLGLLFGVEATNGIMLMLWFGSMGLYYFFIHKHARFHSAVKHIIGITCAMLVYAVLFSIEMYSFSTGKGALQLSLNWFALKAGAAYFPIAYGPPFILGMAGLIRIIKRREAYCHWVIPYVMLLGVGIFFVFFVQNPTEYHFGLLKATRIIPISLLMLTIYFFQNRVNPEKIGKGTILLIALAFPTIITDNIIASDITNPSTFVRAADMDAARWIKKNIPQDAVVQAEPNYPGIGDNGIWPKYAYSFIPIFAQRKTAIGEWKVSSQEHGRPTEVAERFHAIKRMFSTRDFKECIELVNRYRINYIYVGELEKNEYGNGTNKFNNRVLFDKVYSTNNAKIYRVIH